MLLVSVKIYVGAYCFDFACAVSFFFAYILCLNFHQSKSIFEILDTNSFDFFFFYSLLEIVSILSMCIVSLLFI